MVRKPVKRSILDEFRADRGQSTAQPKPSEPRPKRNSTPYDSFLSRFHNLTEEIMEGFNSRDLVYYFREIAQECGGHYVIANMKKEMAIMKRLREDYTNQEICAMVEFLFQSEQDYLDRARLTPGILVTGWCNTIYADTQLWVEDKYTPRSVESSIKRRKSQHEWTPDEKGNSKIGVKL